MRRRRNTCCVHTFFKGLIHSTDYLLLQFTFNSFFFNPFMMFVVERKRQSFFFFFFICWLINFIQFYYVFLYSFISSLQYCQWKQLDLLGDFVEGAYRYLYKLLLFKNFHQLLIYNESLDAIKRELDVKLQNKLGWGYYEIY